MARDTALKQFFITKVQKIKQEGKYEAIIFNQSEMLDFVKKFFPNASFSNYEIEIYGHLAFIKDSHGRYHLHDEASTSIFGRLKYNPLMG